MFGTISPCPTMRRRALHPGPPVVRPAGAERSGCRYADRNRFMTAMSKSGIRRHLRTLEDLIAYGNDLDDARRATLFEYGDCVANYIAQHDNGDAESPAAVRMLCRGIASGSRLSGGFLHNLVRVARAFPPE